MPPAPLVVVLLVLLLSALFYAFWPYGRRSYLPVLLATVVGVLLGQGWDLLGLPSVRFGEADVLPAALFAAALQPLAERVPIRFP